MIFGCQIRKVIFLLGLLVLKKEWKERDDFSPVQFRAHDKLCFSPDLCLGHYLLFNDYGIPDLSLGIVYGPRESL